MGNKRKQRSVYTERRRKRDERNFMLRSFVLIAILVVLVVIAYRALAHNQSSAAPFPSGYTPLGVSVEALSEVVIPEDVSSQMLDYSAMRMSFNAELHIPNYVVWELTREEVNGETGRINSYQADPNVEGCAVPADYRGSGYDRGHMMPAADAKHSGTAMLESFFLTNICPQAPQLNQGSWKTLEEKCRVWADADSAIVIICGPVVTDYMSERIGETGVAVPERFFKVILSPYADPPRAIGFIMPNGKVRGGIQASAVSVDEVERITGYDFFSALDEDIEEEIESQCKFNFWSNLRR